MRINLPLALSLLAFSIASPNPLLAVSQTERQPDARQQLDLSRAAQDDPASAEDDQGVPRVARLSFIEGDVSFLREADTEWAAAVLNLPLLAGDQLYTGKGSRAEIQLGRAIFIRLSEKTALTITVLSESAAQFELTEGIANIRIDQLASAFDRFEVDTPGAALMLQKDGQYRINVRGRAESELIVRRGLADVTTVDGDFKVRDGHRLLIGSETGALEIAVDNSLDDWDGWSYDRDRTIDQIAAASSPDYVTTYETNYNTFFGVSDLSSYGSWTQVYSYGDCWIPRVSSGWAPYRFGDWIWIPRTGWTWASYEPWGWAPYHYGRWVYISRLGWAWAPGFRSTYYGPRYYWWRPALVYFFNCSTPRGNYVAWYPLRPGERWRRPETYSRGIGHSGLQYPSVREGWRRPRIDEPLAPRDLHPSLRNGVTLMPVAGFLRSGGANSSENQGSKALGRARPEAPDRDLRNWLARNLRPGLPPGRPPRSAIAPTGQWAPLAGERPVPRPSAEVINRPIVTRNLPGQPRNMESRPGPSDQVSEVKLVPRERRLVQPPLIQAPARAGRKLGIDAGEGRHGEESDAQTRDERGARPGQRIRPPRPVEGDKTTNDNSSTTSSKSDRDRGERRSVRLGLSESLQDGDRSKETPAGERNPGSGTARRSRPRDDDHSATDRPREKERRTHDAEDSNSTPRSERPKPRDDANRGSGWTPVEETHTRSGGDNGSNHRSERAEPRSEPRAEPRRERQYERQQPPSSETREQRREERHNERQNEGRPQERQHRKP